MTGKVAGVMLGLFVLFGTQAAYAACANPTGDKGEIIYNDDHNLMQFCDDTNWISMGANLAAESDPEVGTLTNTKWCNTDGSVINCTSDAPAGTPAGADTEIQFNSGGTAFGADANLVWNNTAKALGVGGAPNASSILDLTSTTKGFLPPRMLTTEVDAIASPVDGLLVYDTDTDTLKVRADGAWVEVGSGGGGTLASLTDTDITSPVDNSLLRYNAGASKWEDVALQDGLGATTMVSGWPDGIVCSGTDGQMTLYAGNHYDAGNIRFYRSLMESWSIYATYHETTGALVTLSTAGSNYMTSCTGKSIAQLYASGQSFNFIGGGGPWTKAGTIAHYMAGNVGIGTTGPDASALLDVTSTTKGFLPPRMDTTAVGNISSPADGLIVYDTDTDTIKLRANGAWVSLEDSASAAAAAGAAGYVQISDGSGGFTTSGATAGQEFFWDNTNKRLGIGTASPGYKLDVQTSGASSIDGLHIKNATDSHYLHIRPSMSASANNGIVQAGDTGIIYTNGTIGTGAFVIAPWASATSGLRIDASGNVGIGTVTPGQKLDVNGNVIATSYLHSSDARLKENITPLVGTDALALVDKLTGVHFKWKKDGIPSYGFIAQDVEKLMPEAVVTGPDGEDGTEGMKSVDYDQVIPVLLEAIKEQQSQIEALQKRVQELEQ